MVASGKDQEAREFFLLEYQAIEKRLEFARSDVVRTETTAGLAAAGIVSWALAQGDLSAPDQAAVFLIPVIITVVGFLRFWSRFQQVRRVEDYLRKLEDKLSGGEKPGGYENFYRNEWKRGFVPLLRGSRLVWWLALAIGTLYLFITTGGGAL